MNKIFRGSYSQKKDNQKSQKIPKTSSNHERQNEKRPKETPKKSLGNFAGEKMAYAMDTKERAVDKRQENKKKSKAAPVHMRDKAYSDKRHLIKRNEILAGYTSQSVSDMTKDMIQSDIPTSAKLTSFQIWRVDKAKDSEFKVSYKIVQQITEEKSTKSFASIYSVIAMLMKIRI